MDRLPAGDRGTVEHLAFGEGVLLDHRLVEGNVLPLAARIGEPEVDVFHVVVLHHLQDIFGRRHGYPFFKTNRGLARGPPRQIASKPDSPVRIRIASSMLETKILPSPMRPVCAARRIASMAFSTMSSPSTTSIFTLGRKSTTYSAPR